MFDELIQQLRAYPETYVITPQHPDYDDARIIYNRMHDAHPGLIVRSLHLDALRLTMNVAFKNHLALAIRGGGHHIGGFGTCHGGIVIDFSIFKDIHVDEHQRIVSVSPGARLADIDHALTPMGYVLPTGTVSQTGLAGLTLGGGIGWLIGLYGLTCDQLCGADVLLADGRLIQAEDPSHADLLWALRGGGGNFGIVTQFRYRLNPLPETICGMGMVPWALAPQILHELITYMETRCPASMTIAPVFMRDEAGQPSFRIDFCCANGTQDEVDSLLSLSNHIHWSDVRAWSFAAWQQTLDEAFIVPKRGYWKAAYCTSLSLEMIQTLCWAYEQSPPSQCTIMFEHLHGAFKSFDQSNSSFPLRQINFGVLLSARWIDASDDAMHIQWVRQTFTALDPHGTSGAYLNYTSADDPRAVETLLCNTLRKISRVKSHYDPQNLFNKNHNVRPQPTHGLA